MIGLRNKGRPVFILMIALALLIAVPIHAALAALVDTEAAADSVRGSDARARLHHYLAREDVQAALRTQGIDPLEAEARVASLTDAEIVHIASRLDELPAGGVLGFVILVLVIVLLVFVILKVAR